MNMENKIKGSILGGIVGDAYGSPYEFKKRDSYTVTGEMEYNNVFNVASGSFTDDGSMMLCILASLIEKKQFDGHDIMHKFIQWNINGYMSSDSEKGCFDIGKTIRTSLDDYYQCGKLYKHSITDPLITSGNGGLMRLAPIPVFFDNIQDAVKHSILSSKLTHSSPECLESATLMGGMIFQLVRGLSKEYVLSYQNEPYKCEKVMNIANGTYKTKSRDQIKTTGYVIDSLEAALWAFYKTNSYQDGMNVLVTMGDDVDTVCCIYGQIAGAYYGINEIPTRWLNKLQHHEMILNMVNNFLTNL